MSSASCTGLPEHLLWQVLQKLLHKPSTRRELNSSLIEGSKNTTSRTSSSPPRPPDLPWLELVRCRVQDHTFRLHNFIHDFLRVQPDRIHDGLLEQSLRDHGSVQPTHVTNCASGISTAFCTLDCWNVSVCIRGDVQPNVTNCTGDSTIVFCTVNSSPLCAPSYLLLLLVFLPLLREICRDSTQLHYHPRHRGCKRCPPQCGQARSPEESYSVSQRGGGPVLAPWSAVLLHPVVCRSCQGRGAAAFAAKRSSIVSSHVRRPDLTINAAREKTATHQVELVVVQVVGSFWAVRACECEGVQVFKFRVGKVRAFWRVSVQVFLPFQVWEPRGGEGGGGGSVLVGL